MKQKDGIVGFVVFKDVAGKGMKILRDDGETVVLFTGYEDAKSESDWLDVISSITQGRWEELSRPKVPRSGENRLSAPIGGKSFR